MRKNILLFVLLVAISCNGPTKPQTPVLQLTLEDASCADVYLKLQINANLNERTVTLKRDTVELWTRKIDAAETAITDTSLLPGHTYTYTARLITPPPFWINVNSTSQVQVRTMDTTSHDFVWDSPILLGGGSSSVLQYIQILSDTFAIVAGDVYLGSDPQSYGLAIWDGHQWSLRKVYAYTPEGYLENIRPITGIYAFSTTDIWFADGNAFHWNGQDSILTAYWISGYPGNPDPILGLNQGVNKFWGTSSQNLYGCGVNGGLARFGGSTWTKIESGTSLNINDIWGDYNTSTEQYEILCVASNIGESLDREVLKINGTNAQIISKEGIMETLSSVWFKSDRKYYVAGDGIYEKNALDAIPWKNGPLDITTYYIAMLRGNGLNDIVAAGGVGEVLHYNGVTWKSYFSETKLNYGNYNSVAIKNNLIIAVGIESPRAAVLIGRR